jgi:crotonobetainyl-CoA:carnitine CoA-transferase CaiB-like acyl-CoA transferase
MGGVHHALRRPVDADISPIPPVHNRLPTLPPTSRLTYPGAPYRLSQTPWTIRRPAPRLGEHNEAIYAGHLGVSREELLLLGRTGII